MSDDGIEAVVAAHRWADKLADGLPGCLCGWTNAREPNSGPRPTHDAHVATALREAGYVHRDEIAGAREAATLAVHGLGAVEADPSVMQYVDAALAAVAEHLTKETP